MTKKRYHEAGKTKRRPTDPAMLQKEAETNEKQGDSKSKIRNISQVPHEATGRFEKKKQE